MAELPSFGQLGRILKFKANQGNVTIATGRPVGGEMKVPVFATPFEIGDWVKLTGDWTVSKCAATDTEAIGQVYAYPQWKGHEPTESQTWGNYEPQIVSIDTMAIAVRTVQLEAANSAISIGNCVKLGATTAQRFDKATVENGTRALVAADASSGAKIPVLLGFYGLLTRT